jgi:hypothetical protein
MIAKFTIQVEDSDRMASLFEDRRERHNAQGGIQELPCRHWAQFIGITVPKYRWRCDEGDFHGGFDLASSSLVEGNELTFLFDAAAAIEAQFVDLVMVENLGDFCDVRLDDLDFSRRKRGSAWIRQMLALDASKVFLGGHTFLLPGNIE